MTVLFDSNPSPFGSDFLHSRYMTLIRGRFGVLGVYIVLELLNAVYESGNYFRPWKDEDTVLLSMSIGEGCTPKLIEDILFECFKAEIFDSVTFKVCHILTSKEIQLQYLLSRRGDSDRIFVQKIYWLLSDKLMEEKVPKDIRDRVAKMSVATWEESLR